MTHAAHPGPTLVPWSWYSDDAILTTERQTLFADAWHYVGHRDEVAAPGAVLPVSAGAIPAVVVHGKDGVLRAFLNVCRHRGAELVRECGERHTLQCPYHAWTYELDGSLRSAPRSQRAEGFPAEELGLVPLGLETWGPFLFIHGGDTPSPLASALGDIPDVVAAAGIDIDTLVHRHRETWEVAANWKIVCENFLECYHCQVVHHDFSATFDVHPDRYTWTMRDGSSTQYAGLRQGGTPAYATAGPVTQGQFHHIFPALTINIAPGPPNLSLGPAHPLSPSRTARLLDYFTAPDVSDEWLAGFRAFDDSVGAEDRALVESVQQGMATGRLDGGFIMDGEQLVRHFQEYVVAGVTDWATRLAPRPSTT